MLDPATKKWEDRSTTKRFKFVFYCDCCARALEPPEYDFHSGFRPKIIMSEAERKARDLIWQRDHDAAFERSNLDILQNHVHRCEICGAHICGSCANLCGDRVVCDKCLHEKGLSGTKFWLGE